MAKRGDRRSDKEVSVQSTLSKWMGAIAPILWVGVIFGFSLTANPTSGVDPWFVQIASPLVHVSEFLLLAVLFSTRANRPFPWGVVLGIGLLIAFADEFLIQAMMPERVSDLWDVVADAFGLLIGAVLAPYVRRLIPLLEWTSVVVALLTVLRFLT